MLASLAAFVVVASLLGHDLFKSVQDARDQAMSSYAVLQTVKDLDLALRGAETGARGYVLTDDDAYLSPYTQAVAQVGNLEGSLESQVAGDDRANDQLRALFPLIGLRLAQFSQIIALRRSVGVAAAVHAMETGGGRAQTDRIESLIAAFHSYEKQDLLERLRRMDRRADSLRAVFYGVMALCGSLLVTAVVLLNIGWRRGARLEADQRSLLMRLRTSIDSISQGIGVFDADMRLSDWNHCFQELLELPHGLLAERTEYRSIVDHLGGDTALLETPSQIAASTGGPGHIVAYERTVAGKRVLEVRRTHMRDGGFVLTISDMSKRAESEALLRESQKMQAIAQLTGGLAHDFNNLLTVVMGNLELAREKLAPEQSALATRLERSMWAAQRGATLTQQLLAFARRQPLAPTSIDLTATMPELIPLLRRTLGEGIELRFVESAGLWPAMADPAQLEAAVLHLALNARDAMPGGGQVTIELANKVLDAEYARTRSEVTPGDYAMVAVSDTGHGMLPEVMARAFEPFFTTKPNGQGSGLGLAMVFGFVKQSGGHISIYSEPNAGTTVRIYLPRAIAVAAQQRIEGPVEAPRGSATILLVEDEPAVREVAVAILRDLGYRVLEAADAEEALRVFGAEAPNIDLLLTDVMLPGPMRGRELADYIARARPAVRVLYMSGFTENAIVHHGRLDDGVNLISKPFKRDQLAQKVAAVLYPAPRAEDGNVVALRPRGDAAG